MKRAQTFSIAILTLTNRQKMIHRSRTKIMLFSLAIGIAAACLIPANASAEFTLSPQTKGWAVVDITSDSFTIEVKNTGDRATCQIQVSPVTYQYVDNVTTFHPIPPELWQYITVTPEQVNLAAGESATFTVQLAFPNLKEIYNHTWEYRILFNDTNKYTFEEQGPSVTQKTAIIRLYMPAGAYVKPYEAPFYLYPFMIIFSLIFLGGIIIYLKKRSVPLALRDHESRGSEWAGMEVLDHPALAPAVVVPNSERQRGAEAPIAQSQIIRQPMRTPVAITEPQITRSPVWKDVDELEKVTSSPDKDRERKDRKNARARERHALKKLQLQQPINKPKRKAA